MAPASLRTVLVAVDFSEVTAAVISAAIRLAEARDARIVLAHVVPVPPAAVNFELAAADPGPLLADAEKLAHDRMSVLRHSAAGVPLETCCRVGVPAVETCRLARELNAEYIVAGSHGHGAFYELLIGSTTQGILRDAPCPVLVVPDHRGRSAAPPPPIPLD
jgi:nucleotide-binding universal stress UspA family protein